MRCRCDRSGGIDQIAAIGAFLIVHREKKNEHWVQEKSIPNDPISGRSGCHASAVCVSGNACTWTKVRVVFTASWRETRLNSQLPEVQSINKIDKLTLFLSETCNLRCRYCYVRLPDAENRTRMMSEETARNIVRRVFSHFESCNFLQFFGGEPTLNMPAVRAIVDETMCMVSQGIISQPPSFGIVTNGASRHAPEMVAFCREYNIAATVSLDGPKHIHDALRPSARGMGSFDDAVQTIEALLGQPDTDRHRNRIYVHAY